MGEELDVQQLWDQMRELLYEGQLNQPLWDAVETVQPVTLEGNTLIMGVLASQRRHASYITTPANRTEIEALLQTICGRKLDLRIIEGTAVEDWQRIKQRENTSVETATIAGVARTMQRGARSIWSDGAQQVVDIFTGVRARARGTDLAALLLKSVAALVAVEQAAREEAPDEEELHSQQLNRIMDRIATYCDVPATVVALEYMRHRADE